MHYYKLESEDISQSNLNKNMTMFFLTQPTPDYLGWMGTGNEFPHIISKWNMHKLLIGIYKMMYIYVGA
jgi:hypothetical protein